VVLATRFFVAHNYIVEYNSVMSLFSFLKKNKESYSLVFNIGSGSISGGIIKFTAEPGENLLYYSNEKIPFQQEISVSRHLDLMKSSLDILVNRIHTEGVRLINQNLKKNLNIEKVFCVFSSPWSSSYTKTIRIKEPKTIKITEEYLNKYIDEQEKQLRLDIGSTGRVVEKKIVQMKANGYIVNDFNNKLAKDVEFSIHFTIAPEEVLQAVEKSISKTFHIQDIWCHSFSLSIFSIIRNLFPQKDDCLHIDVSEEMTDISVIHDGLMTVSASLPFGRNHYIRELSKVMNVSEEIADSMIKMKNQKIADELANLKLNVSMDKAAADWLAKIYEVLDGLKIKICLQDTIFLVASHDLAPFLKEKIERHDFSVLTLDNKKIKPPMIIDDLSFKLVLMFLDNLYKI
jgi:hypothetical protein